MLVRSQLSVKSRERLTHDVMVTAATHAGLFMTSQAQTATHKMVALTAALLRLSNVNLFS